MAEQEQETGKENAMIDAIVGIATSHKEVYHKGFNKIKDNILKNFMSPKDAMGIDDQTTEKVYAQAYQLYNIGKYEDARTLFSSLVLIDVTETKYLLGLAACLHMLKQYDDAANQYMKCASLDPKSPIPYFHAYDCLVQLNDIPGAMLCLSLTIKRSGDKPEYQEIKNKASMYLETLRQQVKSGEIQPKETVQTENIQENPSNEGPESSGPNGARSPTEE